MKWTSLLSLPQVVDPPGAEYAVLVPLYMDNNGDIRVVLTRRPDHMPTHPGDVVFPGGHREDGEEPIATAKREENQFAPKYRSDSSPSMAVSNISGIFPPPMR